MKKKHLPLTYFNLKVKKLHFLFWKSNDHTSSFDILFLKPV